jgi:hypothetical protein
LAVPTPSPIVASIWSSCALRSAALYWSAI